MPTRSVAILFLVFAAAAATYVVFSLVKGRDIDGTLVVLTGVGAIVGWLVSGAVNRRRASR